MAGYGLTGKRLQPARLRIYTAAYSLEKLRRLMAAYGGGFGVYCGACLPMLVR